MGMRTSAPKTTGQDSLAESQVITAAKLDFGLKSSFIFFEKPIMGCSLLAYLIQ